MKNVTTLKETFNTNLDTLMANIDGLTEQSDINKNEADTRLNVACLEILEKLERQERALSVRDLLIFSQNIKSVCPAQRLDSSHNESMGMGIVQSLLDGFKIGTITIAYATDKNVYYILDGQSRLKDIANYLSNQYKVEPTTESKELVKNSMVDITYYMGSDEQLLKQFGSINNNKTLSTLQKNKYRIVGSDIETTIHDIANHPFLAKHLSSAKMNTEENLAISQLIIANIGNVYSASNVKLVDGIASLIDGTIDTDKVINILDLLSEASDTDLEYKLSKYQIIHTVTALYNSTVTYAPITKSGRSTKKSDLVVYPVIIDLDTVTAYFMAVSRITIETQGANSAPQNVIRINNFNNKLADTMHTMIDKKPTVEQSELMVSDVIESLAK